MTVVSKFHIGKNNCYGVSLFSIYRSDLKKFVSNLWTILKDNVPKFVLLFIILPSNAQFCFLVDIPRVHVIAGFLRVPGFKGLNKFRRLQNKIDHSCRLLDYLGPGYYDVDHFTLPAFYAAKSCCEKYVFRHYCGTVFFKDHCLCLFPC